MYESVQRDVQLREEAKDLERNLPIVADLVDYEREGRAVFAGAKADAKRNVRLRLMQESPPQNCAGMKMMGRVSVLRSLIGQRAR
jgi:hypothetical protein